MDWTKIDLSYISETIRSLISHLPADAEAMGVWPEVALLITSVLIGLYGERLTRLMILGLFVGIGAVAGRQVVDWLSLPYWPTVVFMGSLAGIFAHVLYRYALGMVLAVSLALGCGAWSMGTNLSRQEISDLLGGVTAVQVSETIPAEPATPREAVRYVQWVQGLMDRAGGLREMIADRPAAQKHLLIMVLAGGAAGFLAGLVLGRFAAMLWTSLLAGAGTVMGLTCLAVSAKPEWGEYLSDNPRYVLGAAGGVALLFLLRQLARAGSAGGSAGVEVAGSGDKS